MIERIAISNVTSYGTGTQTFGPLKKINFVYGANGSGKTTISRIIDGEADFTHCPISWAEGNALETLVYNRHFVEQNFRQEVRGIFTLGKDDVRIQEQIEDAKTRRDKLQNEISAKTGVLSGKKDQHNNLTQQFNDQCWKLKDKYDSEFKAAFTGSRNNKASFAKQLEKKATEANAKLHDLTTLKERAATVFADTLTKFPVIPSLVYDNVDLP